MPSRPQCRKEVQEGWNFCRSCGYTLTPPATENEVSINSQISSSGSDRDLMRLLNPGQMKGLLNKTLVVGEGETALSFVDIIVYCRGVQV